MYHPGGKWPNFPKCLKLKVENLIYTLFQKVELCNSTFFQPSQRFSVSRHLSDFSCLAISVVFTVSPSQLFLMSHHLSDFQCLTISMPCHPSCFHCLTISVIFTVSPSQRFSVSHHLSDYQCLTIAAIFSISPSQ